MTPAAATPAARRRQKADERGGSALQATRGRAARGSTPGTGVPRAVRGQGGRGTAFAEVPSSARRRSGALGGAGVAAVALARSAPLRERPRPARAAVAPLPAPAAVPTRQRPTRPSARPALGRRLLATLCSLPDHPLLDRLIRGRIWIPLLGLLLAGIVAMQVEVLKYGARIGSAVQASAALQSRNEVLRASVSALSSDTRIEQLAARAGMVMPAPGADRFVRVARGDLKRALAALEGQGGSGAAAAGGAANDGAAAGGGAAAAAGGGVGAAPAGAPNGGTAAPTSTSAPVAAGG